ncbi:hypothetical protein, partial [Acinetobacter junii]|uniref:hypothetical protein n=1 Tax=Acinetobacter junii TaxID=40215 RepID=UPI0012FFDB03
NQLADELRFVLITSQVIVHPYAEQGESTDLTGLRVKVSAADGYHVSAVHWNYAATTQHRKETEAGDNIRAMSAGSWGKQGG